MKGKPRPQLSEAEKAARAKAKASKFEELANKRTSRALKQIELIGNLSGSGYVSTTEQLEKIRAALIQAIDGALARFNRTARKSEGFKL